MIAPVLGNLQLDYSLPCSYRDLIRRVSASDGLCRSSLRFFPTSWDTAAGEGAYCWSSSSTASSPARCSSVSLSFSDDGDLCFSDWGEELRAIALQMVQDGYMQGLIRGLSAVRSSSEHYGGPVPGSSLEELLGSWFAELDMGWVLPGPAGEGDKVQLHLEEGYDSLLDLMERWIKALKTMVHVLCITQKELCAKRPAVGGIWKAIWYFMVLATGKIAEHEQEVAHFVWFAESSIRRMLDFVDPVANAALNDDHAPKSLPGMLQVYICVVDDTPTILALFKEASSNIAMFEDLNSAFLRKRNKLSDAIWSMMEKVRASFVTDDCWRVSPADAGGIHKTTRLMMNYITLLSQNRGALNFVLQDHHYSFRMSSTEPDYSSLVVSLIRDMIYCMEKQLEKTSNFITNHGLRYIFLMNNCSFISEQVSSLLLPSWTIFKDYKVERYNKRDSRVRVPPMENYVSRPGPNLQERIEIDSNLDSPIIRTQSFFIEAYLEASWEPVMCCLYHDVPRGLPGLIVGTLENFESKFETTYDIQRLWKVQNPELKKRLRKAIIEKVIPCYSNYFTERKNKRKSNRTPKNTTVQLEELLKELFEG